MKDIIKQRHALKYSRKRYEKSLVSLRSELSSLNNVTKFYVMNPGSWAITLTKQAIIPLKRYIGTGSYIRPAGGYISSRFGLRRHPIFKRRRMHTGMDFAAPGVSHQSCRLWQSVIFRL